MGYLYFVLEQILVLGISKPALFSSLEYGHTWKWKTTELISHCDHINLKYSWGTMTLSNDNCVIRYWKMKTFKAFSWLIFIPTQKGLIQSATILQFHLLLRKLQTMKKLFEFWLNSAILKPIQYIQKYRSKSCKCRIYAIYLGRYLICILHNF